MTENRFKIIFDKLAEATHESAPSEEPKSSEASLEELEELRELRRIVLEIVEPEPRSYTTT